MMKSSIRNHKYVVLILVTILIVSGVYLSGYADVTPVSDRTPEVRDAIVAAVPGVDAAADVTETHLAAITSLNLRGKGISVLKNSDFSGLTALTNLNLYNNQLSSLPDDIFKGLTSLTTIRLGRNVVDPFPFTVALEKVAEGEFKAVAPAGALFNIVLPISVTNGSVTGGATSLTIPQGSVESSILTVTRTAGTTADVTVDIGTLPSLPHRHYGYALVKSDTLPLTVTSEINTAPVFTDGANTTRSIAENTATGQNIETAVAATDAENDTLTYTLSGADAASFDIDSNTGQLRTKAALDYESKNTYTVIVTVSDGLLTETITVIINITDVHENVAPSFYEGDRTVRFVQENTVADVNVGNPVLAIDANNDFLVYTLGGVDADAFELDSNGQLKTKAALDYETKRIYHVTITVDDDELSDTITVIIGVIDMNATVISTGFVPVADRTPEVRDAIVTAVPNVTDAANVTEAQVAAITSLNLRNKGIAKLKIGDFSGLTALTNLNLFGNQLSSLPPGIFNGLTALKALRLSRNLVDPMPLIVSLQQVGDGAFKAVITTGAPFKIVLPISVTNGSMSGGATSVTIPQGSTESAIFTVISTGTGTPKVAFGTLPRLPRNHFGYVLSQSTVCNRTEQVAAAIAKAVDVSDCSAVTEVDLATITILDLSGSAITSLNAGDFAGMFSLKTLYLDNNDLTSLPDGIFDDLVSLGELFLNSNKLTTIPSGIFSNLTSLTNLYLQSNDLSSLPSDAFDGLSSLRAINLQDNDLTSLPSGIFDRMPYLRSLLLSNNRLTSIPNGIFSGLTQLSQLHLSWNPNSASKLSLTVTLQKVGTNQFKAVAPTGAPFAITLPIVVTNGTLAGDVNAIVIPKGSVESSPIAVIRTPGTVTAVTADIGTPLPSLPSMHNGYALVKAETLPLEVLPPLNSPPVFEDGANTVRAIAENTAAGTNIGDPVTATDQDANDTLTYTLGGNPDAASFDVDSATGQLKTKTDLDFETKNSYVVTLTVSDRLATDTIAVTINVTDINDAPQFTDGANTTRSIAENTATSSNIGDAVTATDEDNDTLTYTLGGTDAASFSIVSTSGQLQTNAALNYEVKSSYAVTISVTDNNGGKATINVMINVTDANDAPIFPDGDRTTRSIAEKMASSTNIGSAVSATDADNDTLTYSLGGTDAASFSIVSTSGQLQTKAALDYETKTSYSITVSVSDGEGGSDTITVTINVTDVQENRAPTFTEGSSTTRSVAENTGSGANIDTAVSATDPDNDTLSYTLSGTDATSFSITSINGQLRTSAALDYETKNSYSVTITASDGTLTDSISVTINITDVDETPANSEPVFTEGSNATRFVDENIGTGVDIGSAVSATDAEGDTLSYSLSGTDAFSFSIDSSSGQIRTSSSLDYEIQSSYTLTVNVSDGSLTDSIDVTINVTDVNDAPVFTESSSTTRSIAENAAANTNIGTAVSATDEDGDTLTYTLGGIDAASFNIISSTGQLQTQAALDYENKAAYSVVITVSDGNLTDSITVTINITSVNEAPTFTDGAATTRQIAENVGPNINIGSAVTATDPDGDTLTYTLGGTDAASFDIDSTNGQLKTKAALDFETKSTYTVTISVSDGNGGTDVISVTVNVTDLDETPSNNPPVFNEGTSTTRSIAENTAANTNIGAPVAATDADQNTLAYQLGGTDAASFSIDSNTGQLKTSATLNYETKSSYTVTVTVTDGSSTDTITVTVNVTDANDAPQFTDGANTTRSIAENTDASSNIGAAFGATDEDDDTLTYTLSGNDAASFSIVSTSGQLQTKAALNYEVKSSYAVTISVTDNNGGSASINVTISVTDANDAPIFSDGANTTRSIAENADSGADIGTAVTATDADSDTLTYALGGTDKASFSIDTSTGQLQTKAALDFENDSSYTVTVSVSDGRGGSDSITVTINVTNVNEVPKFSAGTTISNVSATKGTVITSVTLPEATDEDSGDSIAYTLKPTLPTGLTFTASTRLLAGTPTAEKASATYTYTASDGTLSDTLTFTIQVSVSSANNAPVFNEGTTATRSVEENTSSDTNIGDAVDATDADNDTLTYSLGGTDAASFSIVSTSGQLRTSAALDYETKPSYSVTVSVSDGEGGSDTIVVTINVTDAFEKPINERTQQVQDAIVAAAGVDSVDDVTAEHLAAIATLTLRSKSITALEASDFDGLTALINLDLAENQLSDISAISGLTKLTQVSISNNDISDISAISGLTKLLWLDANNSDIFSSFRIDKPVPTHCV